MYRNMLKTLCWNISF